MQKYLILFLLVSCLLAAQSSFMASAKSKIDIEYSSLELDDFLKKAYTPTYDCPTPELLSEIEARLSTPNLSDHQMLALNSMKTHSLICDGRTDDAKPLLKELLAHPNANRSAQYYLSAIFQLGFVYDNEEDPTRCKYYELAKDASDGLYTDVHLSANLGYVSECMSKRMNERFFAIFELLDFITKVGEPAAIAHAHNRIGYLYANVGRTNLAAKQYMKGFNVARDVYTDFNLLTLLSNAIINFISSEQYDEARSALDIYIEINKTVESHIAKVREFLLLSNYYLRTNDYINLKNVLEQWRELDAKTSNYFYNRMFAVYSAQMCIYNNDRQCVADFMEVEAQTSANYQAFMKEDLAYRELMVKANIFLENIQGIQTSYQEYVDKVKINQRARLVSANSVNLLELHQEISQLENRLNDSQKISSQLIVIFTIVVLFGIALALYFWSKRRMQHKIYDIQTGLLNEKEVNKRLVNLEKPDEQNTNALAVFNFEHLITEKIGNHSPNYDQCIIDIASVFKRVTRGNDIVGRLEGEKFVICISDVDEPMASTFFDRVKSALIHKSIANINFTSQQIESCVSIFFSEDRFDNPSELLDNMIASLQMKSA